MSMEQLKKVREIEVQADLIRREGQAEAKRIVEQSKIEAATALEKARDSAETQHQIDIKSAEDDANDMYDEMISEAKANCNAEMKRAEKKMDEAVEIVFRKVVG